MRRTVLALGVLALVLGLAGSATLLFRPRWAEHRIRSAPRPLDVLVLTLDTTRADALGAYGAADDPTPNLDQLAREGVRFVQAHSHVPLTLPAHASLMTGITPLRHGLRDNGHEALSPEIPTLADTFVAAGYRTGAFVSAFVLDRRFGLARGFARYEDDMTGGIGPRDDPQVRAEITVSRAISWLKRPDARPALAWVHLYDPHAPYDPPEPYASRFKGRPYRGEVAYMDAQVGRLLKAVAARKRPTLVAVIGDHGEALGEHRELAHGYFIYEGTQRVPLILWLPGYLPGGVVVAPVVRGADFMPTVIDLAGLSAPAGLDGQSLVPLVAGRTDVEPGPAYMESYWPRDYWGATELLGLRTGPWLFIESPRPELYDVDRDPGTLKNLFDSRPADARTLRSRLSAMVAQARPTPGRQVPVDAEAQARLHALGYVSGRAEAKEGRPDAKDNDTLLANFTLAQQALSQGASKEAVNAAHEAFKANPRSSAVRALLGEALAADGQVEAAALVLSALVAEQPANEGAAITLARCRLRQKRPGEAIAVLQNALPHVPTSVPMHEALGGLLAETGRPVEAEKTLRAAVELAPASLGPRLALGRALLAQQRSREAAAVLRPVVERSPHSPEAAEAGVRLTAIGHAMLQEGDLAEARLAYRAVLDAGLGGEAVFANLALTALRVGRRDECLRTLDAGLEKLPDSGLLLERRAQFLAESQRYAEAAQAFRQLLARDATRDDLRLQLASALWGAGQRAEAKGILEDLSRRAPASTSGQAARKALTRLDSQSQRQ